MFFAGSSHLVAETFIDCLRTIYFLFRIIICIAFMGDIMAQCVALLPHIKMVLGSSPGCVRKPLDMEFACFPNVDMNALVPLTIQTHAG